MYTNQNQQSQQQQQSQKPHIQEKFNGTFYKGA